MTASTSLAVLLKRSEAVVREQLQPSLDEVDLTLEHWRIMAVLHEQPGMGMSVLADAAVVPNATLTRLVDKLVERGMVARRVDPADKRRIVAALSPLGNRLAGRLRAEEDAVARTMSETLGGDRFATLTRELELLPSLLV